MKYLSYQKPLKKPICTSEWNRQSFSWRTLWRNYRKKYSIEFWIEDNVSQWVTNEEQFKRKCSQIGFEEHHGRRVKNRKYEHYSLENWKNNLFNQNGIV